MKRRMWNHHNRKIGTTLSSSFMAVTPPATSQRIDLTRNEEKDRPTKRTNSTRAQETLSELNRLVRQEYEVIKKQQGTPEEAAKCAIMRYVDSAINNVLGRMSKDEKKSYWNDIADAFVTKEETSWTRSTMIRKLARHVTNMEPNNKAPKQGIETKTERKNEHTASTSRETGTLVTLQKRNHLKEFHQHMMQLKQH